VLTVAQQENAPNKPVHLMYLGGGVTLFYLTQWTIDWIWGRFGTPPSELFITVFAGVLALTVGIVMYRNERIHGLANEVAAELKKVSWPSAKEVRAATIVVIVMSIISAVVLFVFDFAWSNLTELIYGG
jgi:preprotein translocase subunit SecE